MRNPRYDRLTRWCTLGLIALGLSVGSIATASRRSRSTSAVPTMDISEVRRGMRGHAVTVFHGQTPDQFELEVVDVIHNYLPKQDAVLFRATDPRLEHSGIVGGMSGSPIFLEGKLVGALSYGWRFNKDPLGALTPIANMLEVGALPYRPEVLPHPQLAQGRAGTQAWADVMLGLQTSPLPPRERAESLNPSVGLQPLSIPLSMAGFGPTATRMLADDLGMLPVQGGSSGEPDEDSSRGPKSWVGGDSVSVVLVDGENSVAGNGTVTWVSPSGDRLLAFGHSMLESGPTNIPIADAHVHTIINSVDRSVKLSSPGKIRGLMYQDRQAAIALRTDVQAPMLPITTTVQGPDPKLAPRTYTNRVAFGVSLTPSLVGSLMAEVVDEAARDATEVALQLHHEIAIRTSHGPRTIRIDEEAVFPRGLVGRVVQGSRAIFLLNVMLENRFEIPEIIDIKQKVSVNYGAPLETIESVRLETSELRAGDLAHLEITLRNRHGEDRVQRLPIRIPDDASDEDVLIELQGGGETSPYRPIPTDIDDLITTIATTYPSRSLVATVYRSGGGLSTEQGLLPALPDSVLETIKDQGATRPSVELKQMSRRVIATPTLIQGSHTVNLHILPRDAF